MDPLRVKRFVRNQSVQGKKEEEEIPGEEEVELTWREELAATLFKMDPSVFERLVQRLLRESGFIQVEVTSRSQVGCPGRTVLSPIFSTPSLPLQPPVLLNSDSGP